MPFFLLIPSSIFGLYTLSTAVVPLVCPVALEPFGLTPSTSLYRVAMLAALLLPPVFLRQIALNSWKAARFSLPKRPAWKRMGTGFVLGAVIMSMLQWQFDIRRVDTHPEKWEALEITRGTAFGAGYRARGRVG